MVEIISGFAFLLLFIYALFELAWLVFYRKKSSFRREYWQTLRNAGLVVSVFILMPFIGNVGFAAIGENYTLYSLPIAWYSWPAALVIYEFWYWLQHFLGHKVRLFWCLHAPHHSPDCINMTVGFNRQILELPYTAFFLGFMTALCGVPLEMIAIITLVDTVWGNLLHISPKILNKKYGFLEHILQTPSYHRVHHARNPRYMDTNYNSITLFWDRIMGTLQPLCENEPVKYGITRNVDVESWWDVQFGEAILLFNDIRRAPGIKQKLQYVLMPPGWSHTGDHQMVSALK